MIKKIFSKIKNNIIEFDKELIAAETVICEDFLSGRHNTMDGFIDIDKSQIMAEFEVITNYTGSDIVIKKKLCKTPRGTWFLLDGEEHIRILNEKNEAKVMLFNHNIENYKKYFGMKEL